LVSHPDDCKQVDSLKIAMSKSLDSRFNTDVDNEIPLMVIASAVDPRYKRLKFLSDDQKELVKGKLIKKVKEKVEQAETFDPPAKRVRLESPTVPQSLLDTSSEDDDEEAPLASASSTFTALREIEKYLKEPNISTKECPLKWWKSNEPMYPYLADVAKDILCCPASSTPSERISFTAGITVT
jgi:hypothetical protein